jgi:two-component system LytT family response regulator
MEKDNTSSERLKLLGDNIKNPAKRIALPTSNGIEIIKMEDILFLQADGSYTKIILANDPPITVSKNLKFFEEIIGENAGFFRSHRSYLVNTAFIKRVARGDGGAISLTNGDILPITIDRIEPLIELLSA